MSDYTQITDFSAKDSLSTGDPEKLILGSDFDAELSAISTAIGTKYDSTDLASQAQAEAETSNAVLMTPLRVANWADANGGLVGELQALSAPASESLLIYTPGGTGVRGITTGNGIEVDGTELQLAVGLPNLSEGVDVVDADYFLVLDSGTSTYVAVQASTVKTYMTS